MWSIWVGVPIYCPVTDGLIGTEWSVFQTGIMTKGWALARASVLNRQDYEECGEAEYRAVGPGYDEPPRSNRSRTWEEVQSDAYQLWNPDLEEECW
jgi:hypothetical protein